MPRTWKVGRRFLSSAERAGVTKSREKKAALTATMRAVYMSTELPDHCDQCVANPPVRTGFVRRVRQLNLWLRFELVNDVVYFTLVVTEPPVPLFEEDDES